MRSNPSTTPSNPVVWWLIVGAAILVVAARSSIAFTIGCYDQAIQLEAAHRLVNGLGLTSQIFATYNPDISQPPVANYLTWWPPGLSLLVAGLLALKLPLVIGLKLLYGGITLMGWIGWATILSQVLTQLIRLGVLNLPLHLMLAPILPLFYTPNWAGTDVFLWAGIPYILLLLFGNGTSPSLSDHLVRRMTTIGVLVGALYSIRYATLLLIPTILLWLLQRYHFQLRHVIQSYGIVLITCAPFLAAIALYNRLGALHSTGLPPYVELNIFTNFARYAPRLLTSAPTMSSIFGITNAQPYVSKLGGLSVLIGAGFWVLVGLLPFALLRIQTRSQRHRNAAQQQLLLALSLLPIALSLFLAACTLLGSYDFLGDFRYYVPAILPTIAVLYNITSSTSAQSAGGKIIFKVLYSGLFTLFMVYNLVYRPIGSLVLHRSVDLLQFPLLSTLGEVRYFSNDVITEYKETVAEIDRLRRSQPQAKVFMHSACFAYDGSTWFTPMYMPPDYWQTAYTSQPLSVIWVFFDGICTGDCIPDTVFDKLSSQEGFKQSYTSASEKTRIISVELPAGYRFSDDLGRVEK